MKAYKLKEAADELAVCKKTFVKNYIKTGKFRYYNESGRIFIDKEQVDKYKQSLLRQYQ